MSNKIPAVGSRLAALYCLNRWRSSSRLLLAAGVLLFVIAFWVLFYGIVEFLAL